MDTLNYVIKDPLELNLSYITFIKEGGIFIPTKNTFSLGDMVNVELQLLNKNENLKFIAKVIWITPANALHHVVPGIGVQFADPSAKAVKAEIESCLDPSMELSGYTCGIIDSTNRKVNYSLS